MPTTAERLWCLPLAIESWRKQTYQNRRLLIFADGPGAEAVCRYMPADERVSQFVFPEQRTVGEKYDILHKQAIRVDGADFVAMAPDDDWQAPWYLERRMTALLASDRDRVGCRRMLFFDAVGRKLHLFDPPPAWKPWWVTHGSLILHRSVWQRTSGYPRKRGSGTDAAFQDKISDTLPLVTDDWRGYVAVQHGANTYSEMGWGSPNWAPAPPLAEIMGADLPRWEAAWATRPTSAAAPAARSR
jgi:hypothetical protein